MFIFKIDKKMYTSIKINAINETFAYNTNFISAVVIKNENNSNSTQNILINDENILNTTQIFLNKSEDISYANELCPLIPPNIGTRIIVNDTEMPLEKIEDILKEKLPDISFGGKWSPKECKARHKVAIIVPYRNREHNLRLFLHHMYPFLSKQQLEFGIYIIEPYGNTTFNRGLIMNIGFIESLKDYDEWQCFTFSDVDLLPEDERNIYSCPEAPRHMSSAVSTFKYKLPYETIFGGVTEFTKKQFQNINGFSNIYFGWGGEDDDLRKRVVFKKYEVSRYPLEIGRYTMANHTGDKLNTANPLRFKLLKESEKRIDKDGLNSLKYEVKKVYKSRLFTKIVVDYNEKEISKGFV